LRSEGADLAFIIFLLTLSCSISIFSTYSSTTVQLPCFETCWVRKRGKVKGKGGAGFGASTCFVADVSEKIPALT